MRLGPFHCWLFVLFFFSNIEAKICLNMIVKNESTAIERCLHSVKNDIDYWVIVDTGSTDGTQDIIRKTLEKIPGELHERSWVNFGYNRNEALQLAKGKGDYILFIDADEVLEKKGEALNQRNLNADLYFASVIINQTLGIKIQRALLIKDALPWKWTRVIHEQLACEAPVTTSFLEVTLNATFQDGNRTKDPNKWIKDAIILEKVLVLAPEDPEYRFYLAQSYWNAKEYSLALENYQKRSQLGGWEEQVFWSLYMIGMIQEIQKAPFTTVLASYEKAYLYRPSRAEPLYRMACLASNQGGNLLSYLLARQAAELPKPLDISYIEHWIYEYGISTIFAHATYQIGNRQEAYQLWKNLVHIPSAPEILKQEVLRFIALHEEEIKKWD